MNRRMWSTVFCLALIIICPSAGAEGERLARISLYNPTGWCGATRVEIPVGRISTPGLIDWREVILMEEGREIPWAIREGKAHWKAELEAPITEPRAEDILVFNCRVPGQKWTSVDIVTGKREKQTVITQEGDNIVVTYPDFKVVINKDKATLQEMMAGGESILKIPLGIMPYELSDKGYEFTGHLGPGYVPGKIKINNKALLEYKARMISSSSTGAMTELNFVVETGSGLAMAVTYRIYTNGYLEILADSRKWRGTSPWVKHAVEFNLSIKGEEEKLEHFENRPPFYGYKGSDAAVKYTGMLYKGGEVEVVALGEEAVNGRKYRRRICAFSKSGTNNISDLLEIMDEGLVFQVVPVQSKMMSPKIGIVAEKQAVRAAQNLAAKLKESGYDTEIISEPAGNNCVVFELLTEEQEAIAPDGFAILPRDSGGVAVRASTILGLYKASNEIAIYFQKEGSEKGFPLMARNPVVSFRGGGFGGGGFEVDFPYGSEKEWEYVFEQLLESGMNKFCCLGMWSNWKFPVSYKYMPELQSKKPGAYDEVTGTEFAQYEQQRQHGLKLANYLHERGGKINLWLPIGCVPNTFDDAFPEAVATDKVGTFWGRQKVTPCPSSSAYRDYIKAFLREILEEYSIDGFVMIRDDNGELCHCERCKEALKQSRTKSQAWDMYVLIYDILRKEGFQGLIAVYPYNDGYDITRLENVLPKDMYVVGHGGGAAILCRDYEFTGPMPDTWLDNLYANFRLPTSARMRRLNFEAGVFWIGGAYQGTELGWEAIGYFGFEPTATPNTFRYEWGCKRLGSQNAVRYLQMINTYEKLWEINGLELLPKNWMEMDDPKRTVVYRLVSQALSKYKTELTSLKYSAQDSANKEWFGQLELFAPFIEYQLNRLKLFAEIYKLVLANEKDLNGPGILPGNVRSDILGKYAQIFDWLGKYGQELQKAPGGMLKHTYGMFNPRNMYSEWMAGFGLYLDRFLKIRQYAGTMEIQHGKLRADGEYVLSIELHNKGIMPWGEGAGMAIILDQNAQKIGLPLRLDFEGDTMAPGDRRTIALHGRTPENPGKTEMKVSFTSPYRGHPVFIEKEIVVEWGTK